MTYDEQCQLISEMGIEMIKQIKVAMMKFKDRVHSNSQTATCVLGALQVASATISANCAHLSSEEYKTIIPTDFVMNYLKLFDNLYKAGNTPDEKSHRH